MKQVREFDYKGNAIKIINKGIPGEELYINETLIDKTKTFLNQNRIITKLNDEYLILSITPSFSTIEFSLKTAEDIHIFYYKQQYFLKDYIFYALLACLIAIMCIAFTI